MKRIGVFGQKWYSHEFTGVSPSKCGVGGEFCFFVQELHVPQRSWDEEIYATATVCRNINMLRSLYQIKSWTESHVNDLTGASTHSMVDLQSTGRLTL